MHMSIIKKIVLLVFSIFFSYSSIAVGASLSYDLALNQESKDSILKNINSMGLSLKISSIKPVKSKKPQTDVTNLLLFVDSKTMRSSSSKALEIKSITFDSKGLSNPVKMSFLKKPQSSKATSPAITLMSIQEKKGKMLVSISCSSDTSSYSRVMNSQSIKSIRQAKRNRMKTGSRQLAPPNLCGLTTNKRLFVLFNG
mgnify:CR=1 FL=1